MSERPKIAVIGSCVSRDVLSSEFTHNYSEKVNVVSDIFQSSLISLARQSEILAAPHVDDIKPHYAKAIEMEFKGVNLNTVIESQPDYIIFDFFADIHFGVTDVAGQYVTRNHMAFADRKYVDTFYNDVDEIYPKRGKYEDRPNVSSTYSELAIKSLYSIRDRIQEHAPRASFIVNSARYSTSYISQSGQSNHFENIEQLNQKNAYWNDLDMRAVNILQAHNITYPNELFIADESHKWGLHPVHYEKNFYRNLWQQLQKI